MLNLPGEEYLEPDIPNSVVAVSWLKSDNPPDRVRVASSLNSLRTGTISDDLRIHSDYLYKSAVGDNLGLFSG